MKRILPALGLIVVFSTAAFAHSYKQGDIEIGHIWARATQPSQTTAAVYMPLLNSGKEADKFTGATSTAASKIEIHQSMNMNNMSHMEKLDGVALEPGKPVALRPGGVHLMMFGIKQQLKQGDKFPITLHFEKAGDITIDVYVAAAGAMSGE